MGSRSCVPETASACPEAALIAKAIWLRQRLRPRLGLSTSTANRTVGPCLLENHRPLPIITSPPVPRLGVEVAAHQQQDDGDPEDADEQKNWISHAEHSQNINYRAIALHETFFHQSRLAGIRKLGSPNSMNFIPWKKMLGGYQSSFGFS